MRDQLLNRFLRYIKVDTQSDENSGTSPSTDKQFDLARLLVSELKEMGMDSVELDNRCYVYARLNTNLPENQANQTVSGQDIPKLGFIAHLDTSPSTSGKDVTPQIVQAYAGGDILLNDTFTILEKENPHLKNSLGHTLITTDGATLLGADDKAGIAIIMTALHYLKTHPEIPRPHIRISFTPDEEIGKGALNFDLEKFDADFAYTVDGGPAGEINNETFNADSAVISIQGKNIHPGEAHGVMVNALKIAADIVTALPWDMAPETTKLRAPFLHPHTMEGDVGRAVVKFLLRAFDTRTLEKEKALLEDIILRVQDRYPGSRIDLEISETYRNMYEALQQVPHVSRYLEEAVRRTGLAPKWVAVRGGTDGSGLTTMGLPCPNIFTGGHNYHGQTEWISLDIMEKSVETLIHLVQICAEKSS
jgi:tripeptide aminopeptidase